MRIRAVLLPLAVALIIGVPPATAAGHTSRSEGISRARDVVVTFSLAFQPDGSAAGTFTAAGAVSDSGSAVAHPVVTPIDTTTGTLTGDLTLHGSHGDLTWSFSGITYPLGAPRAIGRGVSRVQDGTADYRGLHAQALFVTTADFLAATVSGVMDGTVRQ